MRRTGRTVTWVVGGGGLAGGACSGARASHTHNIYTHLSCVFYNHLTECRRVHPTAAAGSGCVRIGSVLQLCMQDRRGERSVQVGLRAGLGVALKVGPLVGPERFVAETSRVLAW